MKTVIISIKIFLFLTLLTGIVYPLLVTGIAQLMFREKANGSILYRSGRAIGSSLIAQNSDSSVWFTSRPSAIDYNPLPSGGSNLGLTSARLKKMIFERQREFIRFNQLDSTTGIPSEMLFASASGLDPHISPEAAMLQAGRIIRARHFTATQQQKLIQGIRHLSEPPQFLCLGASRVNVLLLNLLTDSIR